MDMVLAADGASGPTSIEPGAPAGKDACMIRESVSQSARRSVCQPQAKNEQLQRKETSDVKRAYSRLDRVPDYISLVPMSLTSVVHAPCVDGVACADETSVRTVRSS